MIRANSLWVLAAFCLLVVPASSMPGSNVLGYGSGFCPMDKSPEGFKVITSGQLNAVWPQNVEELGNLIPRPWERLSLEETKESDNTDIAKLIARRLIKHIEVIQPQASAWILLMSGIIPEPWEIILISTTTHACRLLAFSSRCQKLGQLPSGRALPASS